MKADHFEQQKLLDLAAEDVALTPLAHRARTLPEEAAVETAAEAERGFSADVVRAETEVLLPRMSARERHFMPSSLLDSQLATLEPLTEDEWGVAVDVEPPVDAVVDEAERAVRGAQAAWRQAR